MVYVSLSSRGVGAEVVRVGLEEHEAVHDGTDRDIPRAVESGTADRVKDDPLKGEHPFGILRDCVKILLRQILCPTVPHEKVMVGAAHTLDEEVDEPRICKVSRACTQPWHSLLASTGTGHA